MGITAFSKTDVNGRVIDYGNGVSIATDDVIYIQNGPNYHTYTFHIKRENALLDDPIENLVLSPMTDGTYKELLVSYNLTAQEKQTLQNGGFVDTKGKSTITELAQGTYNSGQLNKVITGSTCGYEDEAVYEGCSETHNGVSVHNASNISDWPKCTATESPRMYTIVVWKCKYTSDVGTTPGEGGGGNNPPTDPGPGHGGGNPCDGGVATQPQNPDGSDNCGGIPTIIDMPLPYRKTPCTQLKDISNEERFKQQMTELKNNIPTGTDEKGFTINSLSGSEFTSVIQGGAPDGGVSYNFTTMPSEQLYKTYAAAHNHLASNPKHIGSFSPEDLGTLFFLGRIETHELNPYRINLPRTTLTYVITDKGLFALKINDLNKLKIYAKWYSDLVMNDINSGSKDVEDHMTTLFSNPQKYNITHTSTHDQTVTGFLRYIKDQNIGIDLYEGNIDTYGNWKKLTLKTNADGTFSYNEEPCPL